MLNRCILILIVTGTVALSSCHKNESPTSPSAETGKFVVDSIGTIVQVKKDTTTDKLVTDVTLSLVYHYENVPGILSNIDLSIKGSYSVITYLDYIGPESVNEEHKFLDPYQFPDSLIGQDSVEIVRALSGSFWTNGSDGKFEYVSSFSWKDSLFVPVER